MHRVNQRHKFLRSAVRYERPVGSGGCLPRPACPPFSFFQVCVWCLTPSRMVCTVNEDGCIPHLCRVFLKWLFFAFFLRVGSWCVFG